MLRAACSKFTGVYLERREVKLHTSISSFECPRLCQTSARSRNRLCCPWRVLITSVTMWARHGTPLCNQVGSLHFQEIPEHHLMLMAAEHVLPHHITPSPDTLTLPTSLFPHIFVMSRILNALLALPLLVVPPLAPLYLQIALLPRSEIAWGHWLQSRPLKCLLSRHAHLSISQQTPCLPSPVFLECPQIPENAQPRRHMISDIVPLHSHIQ